MVPRLKPGTPGTVVVVVHGGSREHRWCNTAILKTEGNIAWICAKIAYLFVSGYLILLKTGSLDNAIREFSLA